MVRAGERRALPHSIVEDAATECGILGGVLAPIFTKLQSWKLLQTYATMVNAG